MLELAVRALSLMPGQRATPLMKRPYDLRHAGITWRLNRGIPAPEVAKWAGHSVEVLTRIYAKCVEGLDDVWISRMDESLRTGNRPDPDSGPTSLPRPNCSVRRIAAWPGCC